MAALRALWAEKLIFSLKTLQCWIDLAPKHSCLHFWYNFFVIKSEIDHELKSFRKILQKYSTTGRP